jgi:monothiol glutaredoxin
MNVAGRSLLFAPRLAICRLYKMRYSTSSDSKDIGKLVEKKPVVVFMKGTPDQPRCGFSNAVIQILRFHGVDKFDSYNVLEDEAIRQGMLEY